MTYFRALDPYVMRLMDALMAFPAILLAIGIGAALGAPASSIVASDIVLKKLFMLRNPPYSLINHSATTGFSGTESLPSVAES